MQKLAAAEAVKNGIDPAIFLGLLEQESAWNPNAVSHAGAKGLGQFMPATAKEMGLKNPFDPAQAIPASAKYLRRQIDQFGGSVRYGVMAYNGGAGRIKNYLAGKGDPLKKETVDYFPSIAKRAVKYGLKGPLPDPIGDAAMVKTAKPGDPLGDILRARPGPALVPQLMPQLSTQHAPERQIPIMPMGDGTAAVPETLGEAHWMKSLLGKNYDTKTQQVLVSAMPKVRDALQSLQAVTPLADGLPTELDGWLKELIDRA